MSSIEQVILVDENDCPIGTAEKLQAHQQGLCHRAFSIFILRETSAGLEILLQQRAETKYHSPLLWTNTCCSHPRPDEDIIAAGMRRLKEEMGIETALRAVGSFHYIAHFANGLIENEVDHVLIGNIKTEVFQPNKNEVANYRWINIPDLERELANHPEQFTPWLEKALAVILGSRGQAAGRRR